MIYGVGTDLIEIARIKRACETKSFPGRIYTEAERALISGSAAKAAGNFAVKEAVVKSFGTGFRGIAPAEIEVLRDAAGKPYVNCLGAAKEFMENEGIGTVYVSITNIKEYAQAFAVAERKETENS